MFSNKLKFVKYLPLCYDMVGYVHFSISASVQQIYFESFKDEFIQLRIVCMEF